MSADLKALAARLAPHFDVVRPEGAGPFPVVVQMHGCGGVQPMQRRYADVARKAGFAVVVVDSLAPRGLSRRDGQLTVCTGLRLRGRERAGDLCATLDWLGDQPWADMSRTVAAGWSHGGWSIMEALVPAEGGAPLSPAVADLRSVVLIYPYAGPLARTRALGWGTCRPRVAACLAGRDAVVGHLAPRRALARLEADGLEVERLHLPSATHAFDDDGATDFRTVYDPDAERQAAGLFARALASALSHDAGRSRMAIQNGRPA